MKYLFKSQPLTVGIAMFSMFFGAGNVIFPLAVGQYAGDKNFYATAGLLLTGAIMPAAGVIAMVLFDGNYRQFFGRLGKIPGLILALIIISLIGPLGSTPRCIALSYTTLKSSLPDLPFGLFSALSCILIFIFTYKRTRILSLLGWILTPLLLSSLLTIIVVGLSSGSSLSVQNQSHTHMFIYGLKEGYNTMDLLAAFFFSSTILNLLKLRQNAESMDSDKYAKMTFQASVIGILLLAIIYVGFSYLAAFHGSQLGSVGKEALLAAITLKIAGSHAGILVCITIALACLTTAIALISAFTDFIQKELLQGKVSYSLTLLGGLGLTYLVSTFQYTGIAAFLGPILQMCYPGLILLTFLNIAYSLKQFKPIKAPVFIAFAISTFLFFFQKTQ